MSFRAKPRNLSRSLTTHAHHPQPNTHPPHLTTTTTHAGYHPHTQPAPPPTPTKTPLPVTNTKLTIAVENCFTDLRSIRASGGATPELSYYPPLTNLLNAVGSTLKPKVFCISAMAQQGADHPDFGLYSASQIQKDRPHPPSSPTTIGDLRGIVEVKSNIYLNDVAYWRNVPDAVWAYKLGGYQVLKKWLSYREQKVLGRPLHLEEVQHFTNTARRIARILQVIG